jgi:hypothetical protein
MEAFVTILAFVTAGAVLGGPRSAGVSTPLSSTQTTAAAEPHVTRTGAFLEGDSS